jgi:hypothetical protein
MHLVMFDIDGTLVDSGGWEPTARMKLEHIGYDFVAIGRGVRHHVAFDDFSDSDAILKRLHLPA